MSAAAAPLRSAPVRHDAVAGPFGLALLIHALLFAAMTFAVQWRTQPQAPIMAELWSALPPPVVAEVAPPAPLPPVVQLPPPPPPAPKPERPADITLEQKQAPPKPEETKKYTVSGTYDGGIAMSGHILATSAAHAEELVRAQRPDFQLAAVFEGWLSPAKD